jgi:hypothetical protein
MGSELIRIDELRLRIPGLTEVEARRLAEDIARRVSEHIRPGGPVRRYSLLDMRLRIPTDVSREQLASRIAEEIVTRLQ